MATTSTMRAAQIRAYDGKPESVSLVELPVARPGPGQVLVHVAASPINPSDQMFLAVFTGSRNLFQRCLDLKGAAQLRRRAVDSWHAF